MIPGIMKSIENKDFTVNILIMKENIENKYPIYLATDIMHGFDIQYDSKLDDVPKPILINETQASYNSKMNILQKFITFLAWLLYFSEQPSGSTYHLQSISGISNSMEGDDISSAN